MESKLTVKGQMTIPKKIREHLRLKPGDSVRFFVHPDGTVVLLPMIPISALRGILKSRVGRPVTVEEMNEAIATGAAGLNQRQGHSRKENDRTRQQHPGKVPRPRRSRSVA
jgi:AbrB family looped-hinge helix DNA binding protein